MVLKLGGNIMLKVLINGCNGTMGQVLSKQIEEAKGMIVAAGIDKNSDKYENNYPVYNDIFDFKEKADVIIDFSNPESIIKLLEYGIKTETPIVIATTGLSDEDIDNIKKASEKIPVFHSANTSLGINVLSNLVKKAATILSESFDIEIIEKHHNKKVDAPSGTAYLIADAINEELENSMEFVFGREGNDAKRTKKEIGIHAVRGGTIPGEHTVIFAGMDEILEIKHTALSKKIFAQGAIRAAVFAAKQEKGLYTMNDLVNLG
jgi:4-hydroxy-tetrahydrodipicolinate reductase